MTTILNKDGTVQWFRFGYRTKELLCEITRGSMPRNITIKESRENAVNTIISNYTDDILHIRNFQNIRVTTYGFSWITFMEMLNYLHECRLIVWSGYGGNSSKQSTIEYTDTYLPYVPEQMFYTPPYPLAQNYKDQAGRKRSRYMPPKNNKLKKKLDRQIRKYWDFIKKHKLEHNLTEEEFGIIAEHRRVQDGKEEAAQYPDKRRVCPVAVYNDRSVSIGGRFYRAFWIGMPNEARRFITIDNESTCDIDGCAMHVQLLYRNTDLPFPPNEPYLYAKPDPRRKIVKYLMLLMMNTRIDHEIERGRAAVMKTYRKHHKVGTGTDLKKYIIALEEKHSEILPYLYKSNWGELQNTEAAIMLRIMMAAMKENILVLPVHDGCLCQLKHRDRVLELFSEQNIAAEENLKHLQRPNLEEIREEYDIQQQIEKLKIKQQKKAQNATTFSVG